MTHHRVTQTDLTWWFALAPSVNWIFASTYADTAPHSYIVLNQTAGITKEDYVRAGRVIHTFGRPEKFYGMTSIYLNSLDGRLKWWTMDADITQTGLINQATTDRLYGVQNAPSTESGIATQFDSVATSYDELHPTSYGLASAIRAAATALRSKYPLSVLDVGCGTGRVLDLDITTPDRYAGVDSSKPMLNQLIRKHPDVGALYPMMIEQAIADGLFTPGQFELVTVLMGESERLSHRTLNGLRLIASRALVTGRGDELAVLETRVAGPTGQRADRVAFP
jgi:hypothetical protein